MLRNSNSNNQEGQPKIDSEPKSQGQDYRKITEERKALGVAQRDKCSNRCMSQVESCVRSEAAYCGEKYNQCMTVCFSN